VKRALVGLAVLAAGCDADLDPPWQLDHDRVVAVRATPPAIAAGQRSDLDGLIARKGAITTVQPPDTAIVVAPQSLASAVALDAGRWIVTAPDDAKLAAARTELGLPAGAPVPLVIGVGFAGNTLAATKIVRLGATADNPTPSTMMIDGTPADAATEIVVAGEVDIPLSIPAGDTDDVNWLTSVGTMHDFDLPEAYLHVEPDAELLAGEIAVVLRDAGGGVAWRVWPIRVE
jgi:hypothetical protein